LRPARPKTRFRDLQRALPVDLPAPEPVGWLAAYERKLALPPSPECRANCARYRGARWSIPSDQA
jgi:hypothetical protein